MSTDLRAPAGPWDVSGITGADGMYGNSCAGGTTSKCLPQCDAFATAFPTTPAGYAVGNPTVATNANLLQISCSAGYEGRARAECPGANGGTGGTFAAPTGCTPKMCSGNADASQDHTCTAGSLISAAATTEGDDDATCCSIKCSGNADASQDHTCMAGSLISAAATTEGDDDATCCTTPITTANIRAAANECRAESADYNCPISQQTYGPIEDWDVSQVEAMRQRPSPRAMHALVVTAHLIVATLT
jgi:hypothetical protein